MGTDGSGMYFLVRKYVMREHFIRHIKSSSLRNAGVALMIAISVLGVFALLGMYYVRDNETELRRAVILIDELKANNYAKAGLNTALAELNKARQTNSVPELLSKCPLQYEYPYYKQVWNVNDNLPLEPSDTVKVNVLIHIYDESGKVNINCSPASVLQKILKIDGASARQIVSNLNAQTNVSDKGRWIYLVDELFSRGWLNKNQVDVNSFQYLSSWNAGDPERPQSYLNINIAPVEVLMAWFNINLEEAQKIVSAKPFHTVNDVITVLGKYPNTFNFKVEDATAGFPFPFTDTSSSFRIVVTAELSRVVSGKKYNKVYSSHETGVVFIEDVPKIVWSKRIPTEKK